MTLRPAGTVLVVLLPPPGLEEEVTFQVELMGGGVLDDIRWTEVEPPDPRADRRWRIEGLPEGRVKLGVLVNPARPRTAEVIAEAPPGSQAEVLLRLSE